MAPQASGLSAAHNTDMDAKTTSLTDSCPPSDVEYVEKLSQRVKSFHKDPLRSNAYLRGLVEFLQRPFFKRSRPSEKYCPPPDKKAAFVHRYLLSSGSSPKVIACSQVGDLVTSLTDSPAYKTNELVFLSGTPSPEWLNIIGSHYEVDHRFFHHHLAFLTNSQRDWYTDTLLPSRSHNVIRLKVPSILFIGPEDRYVSPSDLQHARNWYEHRIQQLYRGCCGVCPEDVGKSIIRHVNIHSGDSIVLEQELSICLLKRNTNWTIMIWSDAGFNNTTTDIPLPNTEQFINIGKHIDFCPVFFEKRLDEGRDQPCSDMDTTDFSQPLSLLAAQYGHSLDWSLASNSPLDATKELFAFQAASVAQYLKMLERVLAVPISVDDLSANARTSLEETLNFDYAKGVLMRLSAHFAKLRKALMNRNELSAHWEIPLSPPTGEAATCHVRDDFEYIIERSQSLIALCDERKSAALTNASIEEARRSTEEARFVSQITKTTNRLTFVFLPISFVTSVFGMNFKQFGQGPLSITLWLAVTLPLLVVCVVIVELGTGIRDSISSISRKTPSRLSTRPEPCTGKHY